MSRNFWPRVLSWVIMASITLSLISPGTISTMARGPETEAQSQPAQDYANPLLQTPDTTITTASDASLYKLDLTLQGLARSGGSGSVFARFLVTQEFKTWPGYVQAVPLALPDDLTGLPVWYGRVQINYLSKLASLSDLVYASVIDSTGPVPRYRDPDQTAPVVTDEMRARLKVCGIIL